MASGAGANRVGVFGGLPLLKLRPDATAFTTDPRAGYGTIGANDSGIIMLEALGYTKLGVQLCPEPLGTTLPDGFEVSVYGTMDQTVFMAQTSNPGPQGGPAGSTIVPAGSWVLLSAPSEQTGTGPVANPITSTAPILYCSWPLVAVRVCLTGKIGTPAAGAVVYGFSVP